LEVEVIIFRINSLGKLFAKKNFDDNAQTISY
jgi:hypothetical protein